MRDTARFFKVLADEARLQMLWLLFNHQELCVCDLMAALGITQSKASRHLSTLKHAGLVSDRKEGLWSFYALVVPQDELSRQILAALRDGLAQRADAARLLVALHDSLCGDGRSVTCSGACCERAPVVAGSAKTKRARPRGAKQLGDRA